MADNFAAELLGCSTSSDEEATETADLDNTFAREPFDCSTSSDEEATETTELDHTFAREPFDCDASSDEEATETVNEAGFTRCDSEPLGEEAIPTFELEVPLEPASLDQARIIGGGEFRNIHKGGGRPASISFLHAT